MSVSLIDGHIDDDVQELKTKRKGNLRSCPFCGGEAKIRSFSDGAYIFCKHCGVQTKVFSNKEVATEAWNRRVDNG